LTLADEFSPSALEVELVEKPPSKCEFSIVLENTGDVMHSTSAYPTETESLAMISKIGTWLATPPRLVV
jgi:hypothetical protein